MEELEKVLLATGINIFNQVIGQIIDENLEIPFCGKSAKQVGKDVIELQSQGQIDTEDALAILKILSKYI